MLMNENLFQIPLKFSERIIFDFQAMPGVKVQVDIPTDGNSVRTPMVDGEPGQVNFSYTKY